MQCLLISLALLPLYLMLAFPSATLGLLHLV